MLEERACVSWPEVGRLICCDGGDGRRVVFVSELDFVYVLEGCVCASWSEVGKSTCCNGGDGRGVALLS